VSSHHRRWAGLASATVCLVLAVGACGDDDDSSDDGSTTGGGNAAAAAAPLDGKTIAYIETGPIPYYEYTKQGIEQAAEQLGGTAKTYNSNFDPQKELANVQSAITQKVDGIVLEPLSAATTKAALRLTNRAEIPTVVLYGYSEDLEDEAAGFQQTNFADTGGAAGKELKRLVPSGDVAVITGTQGRGDAEGFTAGFKETFGDDSRIVAVVDGDYDRQKAFKAAQDIITKHPDLKGMFVHNEDMSLGVLQALGGKAKDVAIVTQNGSPEGLEAVREGRIKATVAWSPSAEGAMAVRALGEAVAGEEPAQKLCLTPFVISTPDDPDDSVPWPPTSETIGEALETPCAEPGAS
jgi:ribose transport system substrate-binding protein